MDAATPPAQVPTSRSPLPPHLEDKLRTCEAIAARMRFLQQQVDAELARLERFDDGPTTSFYTSPAILAAVHRVLRWIREKVAVR